MKMDELKVTLKMLDIIYKDLHSSSGIFIHSNDSKFQDDILVNILDKYNFDWKYVYNNNDNYGIYLIRGER